MQRKREQSSKDRAKSKQDSRELLKSIIGFMKKEQDLQLSELVSFYEQASPERSIPASIFSTKLSPSEALCLFLKQERGLGYHEIAIFLNRDDRSVWTSCTRGKKKQKSPFMLNKDDLLIPMEVFTDRKLSILEHIIRYLKSMHSLTNSQIASMLKRNPSSIATVAKRAEAKMGGGQRR